MGRVRIAISKGRIMREALEVFARAGIAPRADPARSRQLILPCVEEDIDLVVLRAADVPTYVALGAAELGVTGRDVLMESPIPGLYEPLDLPIARCRMVVAGPKGGDACLERPRVRVATKYARLAREFFAARGRQAVTIKLYGSMELAPLAGLADCIVDLVETGRTLAANGLEPYATLAEINARVVVNKGAWKMRHERVMPILTRLREAAEAAGTEHEAANG